MNDKNRIHSFAALRALALSIIVLHHSFGCSFFFVNSHDITHIAALAVSVFFVLSGFCLTLGYGKLPWNTIPTFLKGRLLRFFPLHWLLICLIALWGLPFGLDGLLPNLLLLQSLNSNVLVYYGYNSVSWFLSCLMVIYMIFPILSRFYLFSIGIAFVFSVVGPRLVDWSTYIHPCYRVFEFAVGMGICKFLKRRGGQPLSMWGWKGIASSTVIEILVLLLAIIWATVNLGDWDRLLIVIPAGLVVAVFSLDAGWISRLFGLACFQWLGSISFTAYMIHVVLRAKLMVEGVFVYSSQVNFLLYVVVLLLLSWMVDRWFVVPFAKGLKQPLIWIVTVWGRFPRVCAVAGGAGLLAMIAWMFELRNQVTAVRLLSISEMRQHCDNSIADQIYDAAERGVFIHPGLVPSWIEVNMAVEQPIRIEIECESGDIVASVAVDGNIRWRKRLREGGLGVFCDKLSGEVRVSIDKNGNMESDHVYVRLCAGKWTYRCL